MIFAYIVRQNSVLLTLRTIFYANYLHIVTNMRALAYEL